MRVINTDDQSTSFVYVKTNKLDIILSVMDLKSRPGGIMRGISSQKADCVLTIEDGDMVDLVREN